MDKESQAESGNQRSGSSIWIWAIVALLVYFLSPGPIIRCYLQPTNRPSKFIESALKPLELMYYKVPPVHAFYDWYFHACGIK